MPPEFPSQAVYSCNNGYTLVGNDMRQCLVDGQWSGVEPSCEGSVPFRDPPKLFIQTAIIIIYFWLLYIHSQGLWKPIRPGKWTDTLEFHNIWISG